jgi:hypothetical protein
VFEEERHANIEELKERKSATFSVFAALSASTACLKRKGTPILRS